MSKKLDLAFGTVETSREIGQFEMFLHAHPGSYASVGHTRWVEEVCVPGVKAGEREAVAWWQADDMVGDAVVRAVGPDRAELKNFRVLPIYSSENWKVKGAGTFMMQQVFGVACSLLDAQKMITSQADRVTLQLDITANNPAVDFFRRQGFNPYGQADLYQPGRPELLMSREIELV
ncbi:MAG TPA: hypothetical protein VK674_05025 [Candidatus Limnocylindria bacterium]|nr:hypothetical protein [Candidatus Limnocylindria bacterium]